MYRVCKLLSIERHLSLIQQQFYYWLQVKDVTCDNEHNSSKLDMHGPAMYAIPQGERAISNIRMANWLNELC